MQRADRNGVRCFDATGRRQERLKSSFSAMVQVKCKWVNTQVAFVSYPTVFSYAKHDWVAMYQHHGISPQ